MAFQSYHGRHVIIISQSYLYRNLHERTRRLQHQHHQQQWQSPPRNQQQKTKSSSQLSYSPYSMTPRGLGRFSGSNPRRHTKLVMTTTSSTDSINDISYDDVVTNHSNDEMPNVEPFFSGILRDYKKRLPYFWNTDFTDGFNIQCLAATFFLFFACLAPAVGFGTLYDKATSGAIGTVEVISSTAGCGIIYALFSAQPCTILASTGPVLAFVAALAFLAKNIGIPFLPLYAWTGFWTAGLLLLSAITSASNMVKYLTKFTDEIFSFLISAIFVMNAFTDIGKVFTTTSTTFTKALLTLVTASTTFLVAYTLKKLRQSIYFTKSIRTTISSFAPTVGILSGAFFARWAVWKQGIAMAALPTLKMPNVFGTTTGRSWMIPIFDLPVWARWAAFLPAIMAAILLYFDQNITVRLVNNPKWKMKKGRRPNNIIDGMHADMLVISILVFIQSLIGLPWLIASTVHSVAHVQALANYDRNEQISSSTEQRLTGTAIHTLMGCCVLFTKPRLLLSQLSLPVFTGLFLYLGKLDSVIRCTLQRQFWNSTYRIWDGHHSYHYLLFFKKILFRLSLVGVTGLSGIEMWQRLTGIVQDKNLEESKRRWTDTVPQRIVNRYTAIQLLCLILMYGVKESKHVGVLFPVVIAALAPIRFALEKTNIIPKRYIDILDED
jgi:HCO3- transporter family